MRREPRTFLELLIRKEVLARRSLRLRVAEEKRILKTRACADDQTIYAIYEAQEHLDTIRDILQEYRLWRAQVKIFKAEGREIK